MPYCEAVPAASSVEPGQHELGQPPQSGCFQLSKIDAEREARGVEAGQDHEWDAQHDEANGPQEYLSVF
eukprot:CAMPEP_0202368230 /NCGR_PEP_ID=MMETSP1127-20130417/392_1 /ASSEMBLY_ACC=CAM_ASM_000462 /TAXON_ID=3047 /ORGANISM="Dunaliella tertiolecta, Strain CCMP1320" /LENGTH=68 /DNA_ID=CAMNT_0048963621 /DNA_START=547 /DNA_END=754 /DNA_ORIENTATION=-